MFRKIKAWIRRKQTEIKAVTTNKRGEFYLDNFIKDSFIAELTDIDRGMILSIDASPITTEAAVKLGENKLLSV